MKQSLFCCLLVITGACNEGLRTVTPRAIGRAAPELRAFGDAMVDVVESDEDHEATSTTARVAMGDRVEVSLADRAYDPDQPTEGVALQAGTFQLPLRDLLADCPNGEIVNDEATRRRYPNCKLLRSGGVIVVGHPCAPIARSSPCSVRSARPVGSRPARSSAAHRGRRSRVSRSSAA